MDKSNEVEALRETLRVMPRQDLLDVSRRAGISHSTVDKFRRGISREPGVFKVQALQRAIAERAREQHAPKRRRVKTA